MNTRQLLLGAFVLCAAPVMAQPVAPPNAETLPFPMLSPQAAELVARGDKTLVFHLRDATLGAPLQSLKEQSGFTFDASNNEDLAPLDKKLSLDSGTRSISEAFRALLDEAGVRASLWPLGTDK